jgi:regulator of protease activity HflC (stomatin/prohibitin superfamily)
MFFKFIKQGTVGLKTQFGKFKKELSPGLNWYVPFVQKIYLISTKTMINSKKIEVKTKDNIFAEVNVNVIYRCKDAETYFFKVSDAALMMATLLEKELRGQAPDYSLEELYKSRSDIQDTTHKNLIATLNDKGLEIEQVYLTGITTSKEVTKALESVTISLRHRDAVVNDAESEKIKLIKEAEADSKRKVLQGEGIAGMRKAIIDGYEKSVKELASNLGVTPEKVMDFLLTSMYIDSYKDLATSKNSKIIVYPTKETAMNPMINLGDDLKKYNNEQ